MKKIRPILYYQQMNIYFYYIRKTTIYLILLVFFCSCKNNYYVFEMYNSNGCKMEILIENDSFVWVTSFYNYNSEKTYFEDISHGEISMQSDTLVFNSQKHKDIFDIISLNQSNSNVNDSCCFIIYNHICYPLPTPSICLKKGDSITEIETNHSKYYINVKKQNADSVRIYYPKTNIKTNFYKFDYQQDTIFIIIQTYFENEYFKEVNNAKFVIKDNKLYQTPKLFYYKRIKGKKAKMTKENLIRIRDTINTNCIFEKIIYW